MSKIQKELAEVTGVNLGRGETLTDVGYLKKLIKAVADLNDKDWNGITKPAQAWFNEAADAANKKKDIPGFPDAEPEPEATPRRRRSSEDDEQPKTGGAYEPKAGDEVEIVTARDKTVKGVVVDPDDKGELVLKVDGEEVGYQIERLKSVKQIKAEPEPEATPRRRRAAEDGEPAKVEDPGVGDTVNITTTSGKQKLGIVVEISDKLLVLKDGAGDELEYTRAKIEKIEIKLKHKDPESSTPRRRQAADDGDEPTPRRGAAADDKDGGKSGDAPKGRATKDENGGVSVTTRARELMCEDPLNPLSLEELNAALAKEKLTANPSTIKMTHADCVKMFTMLKAAKHLK